jgi:hypothetical protein
MQTKLATLIVVTTHVLADVMETEKISALLVSILKKTVDV